MEAVWCLWQSLTAQPVTTVLGSSCSISKFEGICNALVAAGNSFYDSPCVLNLDVLDAKAQVQEVNK